MNLVRKRLKLILGGIDIKSKLMNMIKEKGEKETFDYINDTMNWFDNRFVTDDIDEFIESFEISIVNEAKKLGISKEELIEFIKEEASDAKYFTINNSNLNQNKTSPSKDIIMFGNLEELIDDVINHYKLYELSPEDIDSSETENDIEKLLLDDGWNKSGKSFTKEIDAANVTICYDGSLYKMTMDSKAWQIWYFPNELDDDYSRYYTNDNVSLNYILNNFDSIESGINSKAQTINDFVSLLEKNGFENQYDIAITFAKFVNGIYVFVELEMTDNVKISFCSDDDIYSSFETHEFNIKKFNELNLDKYINDVIEKL